MIQYYIQKDGRIQELETPGDSCWINISPPFNHEELKDLADQHGIPLDFLTDSLDIEGRV